MKQKIFNEDEAKVLEEIILHRRDIRGNRFLQTPISEAIIEKILFSAINAPSVGFSQPWEFVIVKEPSIKEQVKQNFNEENKKGAACFKDEKHKQYLKLKLEGITEAPVNIAVFYKPAKGPVLGQTSMKEMGLYSVVCAVQNMWLMARALNIGIGWVSLVNHRKVKSILNAPKENRLIAYLCIGYVSGFLTQPELEILQWEERKTLQNVIFYNKYKTNKS